MPQIVEFPAAAFESRVGFNSLVRVCKDLPKSGEPFREFRTRLRAAKLWDRERPAILLQFLGVGGATIVPSPFMVAIADGASDEQWSAAVADRLWECNPLLVKTVVELLGERAYHKDEVSKHLGSVAYRGAVPARPMLEVWIGAASIAGLVKQVGIAIALGPSSDSVADRGRDLDVDEFLATDKPWPAPVIPSLDEEAAPAEVATSDTAAIVAATSAPVVLAPALVSPLPSPIRHLLKVSDSAPSPRGREKPTLVARFANGFSDELLGETAKKLDVWWSEVAKVDGAYTPSDFELDPEQWVEGADEVVYRVAVAAALVFRLERERPAVIAAFAALQKDGVLVDLYQGTIPEQLPRDVDAKTLMLASLAARRCAEAPELAASLETKASAAEAFVALESALGRGLFRVELFWMLDMLAKLGVLRFADLGDVTTVPYRIVRDTLFRLGFIDSPYASTPTQLQHAAKAARSAAGEGNAAELLATFALSAGCTFDCPHRKTCDWPCRERLET